MKTISTYTKLKSRTMSQTLKVKIWRENASDTTSGSFQTFEVPARKSQTVLDIVTYIQRNLDSTLSYRFACRVGMCGSCAMTVNGIPRWTCRTHADKETKTNELTIEPLANLPVIADLTTDMAPFFEKWQKADAKFIGKKTRHEKIPALDPTTPKRQAASFAIECINCAVCYSACDTVSLRDDYVGPAALNRAWSLLNDIKHIKQNQLKRSVKADGGCYTCHTHTSCTQYCPVNLDPAGSIASIKRAYSLFGKSP